MAPLGCVSDAVRLVVVFRLVGCVVTPKNVVFFLSDEKMNIGADKQKRNNRTFFIFGYTNRIFP
jgi:hypothetical protein